VAQIRPSVVVLNCENAHSHEDEDGKNVYSAVGGERLAEHPAGAVYIVIASCIRSVENRSIPTPRGSRRIGSSRTGATAPRQLRRRSPGRRRCRGRRPGQSVNGPPPPRCY
jgi:hypothetical protein